MSEGAATPHADHVLIDAIRHGLRSVADPAKASQMQAYMKSPMPFHGVHAPEQRSVFRAAFRVHPLGSFEAWHDRVLALWRGATHREEWYAVIELARAPSYQGRSRAFRTR